MSSALSIAFKTSGLGALAAVAASALFFVTPNEGRAQESAYPERPVRIIVGRPPGGVADIAARVLGHHLSERWKQQVVIDNRPGSSGLIAIRATTQAAADGYTLMVAPASDLTVNRFVLKGWQASFDDDIIPVARITMNPVVLVAHAGAPFSTVRELIDAAKASPGRITFGSAGLATSPHLVGELFAERAGIQLTHVPYKGGPGAASAAAGGHTDLAVMAVSSAVPLVKGGKIKVIGLSTRERLATLPDWPTLAEGGLPGFEADIWTGLYAHAATPPAIVKALQADVVAVLAEPALIEQYRKGGAESAPLFGAELAAAFKEEIAGNGKLVSRLKIGSN